MKKYLNLIKLANTFSKVAQTPMPMPGSLPPPPPVPTGPLAISDAEKKRRDEEDKKIVEELNRSRAVMEEVIKRMDKSNKNPILEKAVNDLSEAFNKFLRRTNSEPNS